MSSLEWTRDHTMRFLNANPLPEDFRAEHRDGGLRAVKPSHRAITGYGKWLRETPYFQGLFELIHDILATLPVEEELGDGRWLAELITARVKRDEQGKLL